MASTMTGLHRRGQFGGTLRRDQNDDRGWGMEGEDRSGAVRLGSGYRIWHQPFQSPRLPG